MRSFAAFAIAVAMTASTLSGCGSDDPAPASSTDDRASAPPTSAAPVTSPLEGTWQGGPISPKEAEATLRRHGLDKWIEAYRPNAPLSGETLLSLSIEDGVWDLYGESGGGQPEPIDYDAEYKINGDRVVFVHSDGANTYQWSIDDDNLRLKFIKSTMPAYNGIPEEVFQRALYMTASFTRQD